MAAPFRGESFFSDKVFHNGQAELLAITENWERRRHLAEHSVRDVYFKLMGELMELLTAVSSGKSPEYSLIELADVLAYTFKYPGLFMAKRGREVQREVSTTLPRVETFMTQALLAAPQTHVSVQDRTSVDTVMDLAAFFTEANGALAGIRVDRKRLTTALSQMITILGKSESYTYGPDKSKELTKEAERQILAQFAQCFDQPLNGHLDMHNAATVIPEMYQVLEETSRSMFGYSGLENLAASFYFESGEVMGKNARNYLVASHQVIQPNGEVVRVAAPTKKQVRAIRDQFPLSIIPPGFVIGGQQTPRQFLAQRYPGKRPEEIAQIVAREQIISQNKALVESTKPAEIR